MQSARVHASRTSSSNRLKVQTDEEQFVALVSGRFGAKGPHFAKYLTNRVARLFELGALEDLGNEGAARLEHRLCQL